MATQKKNNSRASTSNGANPYRKDFPIFKTRMNGKPLVYLDSAATSQKPQMVLDAIFDFYTTYNANIHRGIHTLSQKATDAVEEARESVAKLIGAKEAGVVVFTSGTTMSINHVAYAWAERRMAPGDEIILSISEHHGNLVPWLELKKRKRVKLSFVPLLKNFELDYAALEKMVSKKTKLISLVHISNVIGVANDVPRIVRIAKRVGARVLIDAAQSIARETITVADWGIDFLAFSGHKMYGPTGIGALYIKNDLADSMGPFMSGGGAILEVTQTSVTYLKPPHGFEGGTPHIAGMIGLGAAARYILKKGIAAIKKNELAVSRYAYTEISKIPGLTMYGPPKTHGVLAFAIKGLHPHDIAEILNRAGVAIRAGNHCAMPLHRHLGVSATARITLGCYNTREDIDVAVKAIKNAQRMFA
ncbi:MAG: hypothetical protein A3B30_02340 [Candidatus Komeilibacteria bacterium RIFCSPLOWO2_01_FULL_52_15]|uniref:Cysteine desulfurase n=2 Tax=Candidatus Komeiliibacteriota TaxID=1817908 RepID=A0A1G2BRY5_9BACT|nr:MAG: hypothetical protein A2677_03870 [Candidatus Komeilibacteria bacterium RIFCSPHIGHO2_01_FULL_52_14]OGY91903.1 MAG: hypothetical protein A3B30_02340 [Candidatus Komeilibacteria bacterium RIFCSPLOWO2_01_FULL_52_15]